MRLYAELEVFLATPDSGKLVAVNYWWGTTSVYTSGGPSTIVDNPTKGQTTSYGFNTLALGNLNMNLGGVYKSIFNFEVLSGRFLYALISGTFGDPKFAGPGTANFTIREVDISGSELL